MARDNKMLGNFKLDGIKPARRGEPRIEVSFNIDANGIVNVSAKDLDTNKEQSITIQSSSGLSKEDIERMIKEAELNKESDEKRKEEIELRNKAEQYISSIDRGLEEQKDKIDENQRKQTEQLRDELKKALDANDYETLKNKIGELEQAAAMMAQYANQQQTNTANTEAETTVNPTNDQDVVDVDYSEK